MLRSLKCVQSDFVIRNKIFLIMQHMKEKKLILLEFVIFV